MKKLIVILMLMGLVTTVNAQIVTAERDYIMEQVLHSVSSLKFNNEKINASKSSLIDFSATEDFDLNPFQYIRQQADYISIASTVNWYGAEERLTSRRETAMDLDYLLGTSAEVMYGAIINIDCNKSKSPNNR